MKYNIEFNEERHEYTVNGIIKPSVSQIINLVVKNGEVPPPYAIPSMRRGVYIHSLYQLMNSGCLDYSTIQEEIPVDNVMVKTYAKGYLESLAKFQKAHKFIPRCQEMRGYDPENNVCGTIDEIPEIDGEPWIIDYKTGQIYDYYRWQLTGYKTLILNMVGAGREKEFICHRIGCLQVFKDGKMAQLHEFAWEAYEMGWEAICTVYKIKTGGYV